MEIFAVLSKSVKAAGGMCMISNSKNKERIVHTAMELFRQKGYSSVTVKDICAVSGVPSSSFYTVFSGKDDILTHVLKGHMDSFEDTMLKLLEKDSSLEKLWVLYGKYLDLGETFGAELIAAMLKLELDGRLSLVSAVNDYVKKYNSWFVRFIEEAQKNGDILNPGAPAELMQMGVRLSYFVLFQWCACKGAYPLKEKAYAEMELFYNVREQLRGIYAAL